VIAKVMVIWEMLMKSVHCSCLSAGALHYVCYMPCVPQLFNISLFLDGSGLMICIVADN